MSGNHFLQNMHLLSKYELEQLPLVKYQGPIYEISDQSGVEAAYNVLKNERILGFDTESRPSFRKGVSFPPSILQLASEHSVYLFFLRRLVFPNEIVQLLENPEIIKTGVATEEDIRRLHDVMTFNPAGFIDLGGVTLRGGMKISGIRNLAANFLGFRISKKAKMSNWDDDKLDIYRIQYAATDAWISREIYISFNSLGLL